MASAWTEDVFSVVNGDRMGNHLTSGVKTGKLPLHFHDVKKVWGHRFDRLIDLLQQSIALFSRAVIQGGHSININTMNQSSKLTLEESLLAWPTRCHDGKDLGLWKTMIMSKRHFKNIALMHHYISFQLVFMTFIFSFS